jgi:hypothetical protein
VEGDPKHVAFRVEGGSVPQERTHSSDLSRDSERTHSLALPREDRVLTSGERDDDPVDLLPFRDKLTHELAHSPTNLLPFKDKLTHETFLDPWSSTLGAESGGTGGEEGWQSEADVVLAEASLASSAGLGQHLEVMCACVCLRERKRGCKHRTDVRARSHMHARARA